MPRIGGQFCQYLQPVAISYATKSKPSLKVTN